MALKLKPLQEQVIVITGTSSGIGLVTARMAAKAGAKLVLASRNEEAIRQLANEINSNGGVAIYVATDVGVEQDVNRLAERAIAEFGTFDTWVNNAGVSIFGATDEVTIDDMKRMFDTNFWGVVYGSRAAVKHFKERKRPGAVINVGSFFGDRATPVQSTYSASKNALHGFTEAMRMELEIQKAPVSVSLIHPGRIDTPYNEHARSYQPQQPAHGGYIYPPESVAEAILYCAENPKRDMYVGFQSKIFGMVAAVAPRFMDKVMELIIPPTQRANRPSNGPNENGLHHPGYGLQERGTHVGYIRSRSYYVKIVKHPVISSIIFAGLAAGLLKAGLSYNRKDK